MARRNRKGQFVKGSRKGKRGRKGTRGFGSIISIRRGMGAIPGGAWGEAIIPALVGGSIAGLTALGIRMWVDPSLGTTQRFMVKYAPLLGEAAGIVASLGLLAMGSKQAAVTSSIAAIGVGMTLFGHDYLLNTQGGRILGSLASSDADTAAADADAAAVAADAAAAGADAAAGGGTAGIGRRRSRRRLGTGAIVPEYSQRGMGAITMENMGPNGRRAGSIGSYGETVSLQGINTGAFGTPGFHH